MKVQWAFGPVQKFHAASPRFKGCAQPSYRYRYQLSLLYRRTSVEEDDLLGLHAREAVVALAVIEAVETFLESPAAAELVVQLRHRTAAVLLREVQLRQFSFAHAMAARVLIKEGYEPDVLGVDHAVRGARMVGCQEAIEMFGTRPGVLPLPFAERHATPFGAARGTTMSLDGVFHDALYLFFTAEALCFSFFTAKIAL